ncbi:MAG TPA: hypothetical protein VNJ09_00640 [Chthonomonadales bacterium]|jgi:hypothetical protein|nr:hypothetical protein [Chthonomonadales bacterium]
MKLADAKLKKLEIKQEALGEINRIRHVLGLGTITDFAPGAIKSPRHCPVVLAFRPNAGRASLVALASQSALSFVNPYDCDRVLEVTPGGRRLSLVAIETPAPVRRFICAFDLGAYEELVDWQLSARLYRAYIEQAEVRARAEEDWAA